MGLHVARLGMFKCNNEVRLGLLYRVRSAPVLQHIAAPERVGARSKVNEDLLYLETRDTFGAEYCSLYAMDQAFDFDFLVRHE